MQQIGKVSNGDDIMKFLKKIFAELNKRGVSATVIAVILIVVGLAILLVFLIGVGTTGSKNVEGIVSSLDRLKAGGA